MGGYSTRNKGDHAMLLGLLNLIKLTDDSLIPVVYSTNTDLLKKYIQVEVAASPELYFFKFSRRHKSRNSFYQILFRVRAFWRGFVFLAGFFIFHNTGVSLLKKKYCREFFARIQTCRAIIFSGGGYINSLWWLEGFYAKLFPVILAKWLGIPVFLTSQGIGPFRHPLDKLVAAFLFSKADLIGVRDTEKSIKVLENLGIDTTAKIVWTGDDSLLLDSCSDLHIENIFKSLGIPQGKILVGVNFRDGSVYASDFASPDFQLYANLLDGALDKDNIHVIFIPISYNCADDDRKSAENIADKMRCSKNITIINDEYSPSELKGIIGAMNFVVGTSYHFNLFAMAANVPAVGIYPDAYYKQKLQGLFSLYKMEDYCFALSKSNVSALGAEIQLLLSERDLCSDKLRGTNSIMSATIQKSHELLAAKLL
jgi:polysaccharide pyruvyl transferase WcaK-like protein